jgi:hypothetical protein
MCVEDEELRTDLESTALNEACRDLYLIEHDIILFQRRNERATIGRVKDAELRSVCLQVPFLFNQCCSPLKTQPHEKRTANAKFFRPEEGE